MDTSNETFSYFFLNSSSDSVSSQWMKNSSLAVPSSRHLSAVSQVVITAFYLLGILGNMAALGFLLRSDSQPRNPRLSLMLRCLASNDLLAVLGMMTLMNLQLLRPALSHSRVFCGIRVFWKLFGLGSGCVAIIMAVERWCALTRPFFYQKHVTTAVIRRGIFTLWFVALLFVCLPFLGFGMYFEPSTATCARYRMAHRTVDVAYAYLFLVFGSLLCLGIVWCNLAVARALCHAAEGCKISDSGNLPRRFVSGSQTLTRPSMCTKEELAFARLMAILCVLFVVCWMPQMISIPIAQVDPNSPFSQTFFRMADVLMLLHFCLDPYVYVLQRWPCFRTLCSRTSVKTSLQDINQKIFSVSNKEIK